MLRESGIDDQLHYWFLSGDQTTTIEWELVLAREVNEEALNQAVLRAMQIHTNFRSHPIIVGGRVKVSIDDVKQVPVFAESGSMRQFGTAQTKGYLFYFSFSGHKLFLRLFHGLSDGRGSLAFLTTVLAAYAEKELGVAVDTPVQENIDAAPVTERILEEYAGCTPAGRFDAKEYVDEVFHLPVEPYSAGERKWRVFEIDLPLAPLLTAARSSESSIVPALEVIIGNAIRRNYDVEDKIITGYTPVDMRPVFHLNSGSNASTSVAIPYREKLDHYDLRERFMLMRSILDLQIQPENIYTGLLNLAGLYKKVNSQPYPIEGIVSALKQNGPLSKVSPYTYGLSYPGKISFPKQVESLVDAIVVSVSGCSFPLMMEACEYKGTIRIMLTQIFDRDEAARIIYEEIAGIIPEAAFIDRGVKNYDRMDLETLEHIG